MDDAIIKNRNRGYTSSLSSDQVKEFRRRFSEKSICKSIGISAFYLVSIYCSIYCFYILKEIDLNQSIIILLAATSSLFISRQMRALENIVHFGSHYNFSKSKHINDRATNVIAAWPMLSDVDTYRSYHMSHHGRYGGDTDPCKRRFERMKVKNGDFSSRWKFLRATIRWFPGYVVEYYKDIGSRRVQLFVFAFWHVIFGGVLALLVDIKFAIFSVAAWFFCMFCILPFVRLVAEVGEHDYERESALFDTTFNNIGPMDLLLFHPAGDAWHVLHHLYPAVPWWKQRQAHKFLILHDDSYRNALQRRAITGVVSGAVLSR
ncbi:fatty acid desaturase [Dyella flava]|uniref:Fatty acid desaturase n=1 Tax=Dyella flava TaxID=1920170 RepID=A0ABS2K0L9_9GAMM|nr:fatty acid desaturase [Dyella flava]MBM7124796.1 fatty acid desaturase [Dyella flava]